MGGEKKSWSSARIGVDSLLSPEFLGRIDSCADTLRGVGVFGHKVTERSRPSEGGRIFILAYCMEEDPKSKLLDDK